MNEEIPIKQLHNLRDELNDAIEEQQWDEVETLAKKIVKIIPIACDQNLCQTGIPHLDGVYSIGTMTYQTAPKSAKRALNYMNRIIKAAKRSLRSKKKRK